MLLIIELVRPTTKHYTHHILGTLFVSPVIVTTATVSMGSTYRRAMADLSVITWVRV